ncbi:hypothetical protein B0H14DRAFT_2642636 [Mycena olivaceomarginata]|nr:hypothetical protein B0H14DRAFT_2642636 [Mycena olivaceomarginata]
MAPRYSPFASPTTQASARTSGAHFLNGLSRRPRSLTMTFALVWSLVLDVVARIRSDSEPKPAGECAKTDRETSAAPTDALHWMAQVQCESISSAHRASQVLRVTGGEEREIRNTESKRRVGKGWMLTPRRSSYVTPSGVISTSVPIGTSTEGGRLSGLRKEEKSLDHEWTSRQDAQTHVQARDACSTDTVEVPSFVTRETKENQDRSRMGTRQQFCWELSAWSVDESFLEVQGVLLNGKSRRAFAEIDPVSVFDA